MSQHKPVVSGTGAVSSDGSTLDLRSYADTLLRRRWLAIPFFVVSMLMAAVLTLRQTRIYDATCTIVIDLTAPRVLEKDVQEVVDTGTGGFWYSREYYETQYKVITSRAVAQRAADRLGLGSNSRFLGVEEASSPAETERRHATKDPVAILQKNLKIDPIKESRIVRIRYEDPDREMAAMVANGVADAYVEHNLAVRSATTQNASEWLEGQLTDLEAKVASSSKALFDFKKTHDIVATTWEDRQGMVSQRLSATNDALARVRVRKAELQARADGLRALEGSPENLDDAQAIQPLVANATVQALKLRYFDARAECEEVRSRYLDHHPKMETCNARVALAREGLRKEIQSTLAGALREYDEIAKTEKNLIALLNDTKSEAFGLNQYEREYLELKRGYDNNQRLYDLVLKRLKDTGVTGMLQVSNVRVLDRARANEVPVRPKVLQNFVLAAVFGLLGAIALAFAAESLDASITTQEQVERVLGLAFLGIIPTIDRNKDGTAQDLVVHTHPKSATAECLRALRTNLLFMSPEKPLRTIVVTSSGPQDGKTTTAVSLAITMAGSGNRVLLVDADMRRPRIHRVFGIPSSIGLSSLILGEESVDAAVKTTGVDNLFVLPCGPIPPNPAELLHTQSFSRIVAELAAKFDRVIIDSPPAGVVADSIVMSTQTDGTLVVLKAGRTSRDVARRTVRQLRDVNANLLGAVLNDLDLHDRKYGQSSYYYQYGYYYGESQDAGPANPA